MLNSRPVSVFNDDVHYSQYSRMNNTKTPGKSLKGRIGLQENILKNGSYTSNPKENRVVLQTPFRQGGKIILQDAPVSMKPSMFPNIRPLGDKTPAPNRQNISLFSPRNGKSPMKKFILPVVQDTNEFLDTSSGPPSSARKLQRGPRTSNNFKTPITKGDYWNVSDVSIDLNTTDTENEIDPNEPDYSDLEYAPPTLAEPNFEMHFELPDYKEVGKTLRTLAQSYPLEDTPDVYRFDINDVLKGCDWFNAFDSMNLNISVNDDDDDIFGPRNTANSPAIASRTGENSSTKASKSTQNTNQRTIITRSLSSNSKKLVDYPPRPATSTSIRQPDSKSVSTDPRPSTSMSNNHRPVTRADSMTGSRPRAVSSSKTRSRSRTRGSYQHKATSDSLTDMLESDLRFIDDDIEEFRFAV